MINPSIHSHSSKLSSDLDVTGNIAVTGTVDGIDIAARDAILTSTTTTANAALPKDGSGSMSGNISLGGQMIQSGYLSSMTMYSDLDAYGNKVTGLADGSSSGDAVNYSQFASLVSRVETLEYA